jgi:hypothetical protein
MKQLSRNRRVGLDTPMRRVESVPGQQLMGLPDEARVLAG